MRIAFFCPHSDPLAAAGEPDSGGQCVYEAQVAARLAQTGHEVRAYTRLWGAKSLRQDLSSAAVYRYSMGPEGFLRKEDMAPYLAEFAAQLLKDQRPWLESADICHGHYWDGGVAALIISLALGKPLVFTSHSLGILKQDQLPDPEPDGSLFRYPLRIAAERKILQCADGIIALSQVEQEALTERYGTSPSKIRIVPGGVDLRAFRTCADKRENQRRLGATTDYMLLTVGRLDPRKGFLELIEAIPFVVERLAEHGKTVTFMLPSGPERPSPEEHSYRRSMQERAEALQVMNHIRWFPRLSDDELHQYYAAADVFLCPSPYEPFGLVLVEAFASGTPVVATPHGGPREIVTEGEDGYLAEPSDPRAFSERILAILLASEGDQKRLQQAALDKARRKYAWPAVAEQIAQVYQALL